jgi:hypothetical protein
MLCKPQVNIANEYDLMSCCKRSLLVCAQIEQQQLDVTKLRGGTVCAHRNAASPD